MSSSAASGPGRSHLSTPALVVDLDVFEANVAAMDRLLEGSGKTVRPHVKTHRTPELARRQLGGHSRGVTCATVGEAEAMAAAGIGDILVANEVVDPAKLARIVALAATARVTIAADDPVPVAALSAAAVAAGVEIGVLVDVDILLGRCGVTSPTEAVRLGAAIDRSPGLRLEGVMGYEGRLRADADDRAARIGTAYDRLAEAHAALRAAGLASRGVVSAAGTSTLTEALADPTITEIQAGVYALMEPQLLPLGLPFRCAASVRGTVISRRPGRAILDVGRRSIGLEYGLPLPALTGAIVAGVNDEHTILETVDPPPLGSQVDLVPGQVRTTFNLHDSVWLARRGDLLERWPVSARGRSD